MLIDYQKTALDMNLVRPHGIRVQFATKITDGLETCRLALTGSVPELGSWNEELSPNSTTKLFLWDILFDTKRLQDTKELLFTYEYRAYNQDGKEVWRSRLSKCRFTLSKLLCHRTNEENQHADCTKVVIVFNSNDELNDSCDLILLGSSDELGNWDIKKGKFMKKENGSYKAIYFVRDTISFSYSYMKVQNGKHFSDISTRDAEIPSIIFSSSTASVSTNANEKAVVILIDEWDINVDEMDLLGAGDGDSSSQSCSNSQESLDLIKKKTPEQILQRHRELSQRVECKVCKARSVEVLFVPCGHVCVCRRCAGKEAIMRCPLCRKKILKRMRCFI